jgi:hypothetical protein
MAKAYLIYGKSILVKKGLGRCTASKGSKENNPLPDVARRRTPPATQPMSSERYHEVNEVNRGGS